MPRIPEPRDDALDPRAKELLAAAEKKIGRVPNMLRPLANSAAALDAYLTLSETLSGGTLSPELREHIALTMAGANACVYCASAHTAIGRSLSIDEDELAQSLAGRSGDPRTAATLDLVRSILEHRGAVDDNALDRVRDEGLTNGEIVEIVAHVALNVFTNYLNRLVEPEIDFPVVALDPGTTSEPLAAAS